jgi:hypothetical protein
MTSFRVYLLWILVCLDGALIVDSDRICRFEHTQNNWVLPRIPGRLMHRQSEPYW